VAFRYPGLRQGGIIDAGKELMINCAALLTTKGFPGIGATFEADLNLVVQAVMGAALIGGRFSCETKPVHGSRNLPDDGAAPEFVDDRTGDVAFVPTTSEAGGSGGCAWNCCSGRLSCSRAWGPARHGG